MVPPLLQHVLVFTCGWCRPPPGCGLSAAACCWWRASRKPRLEEEAGREVQEESGSSIQHGGECPERPRCGLDPHHLSSSCPNLLPLAVVITTPAAPPGSDLKQPPGLCGHNWILPPAAWPTLIMVTPASSVALCHYRRSTSPAAAPTATVGRPPRQAGPPGRRVAGRGPACDASRVQLLKPRALQNEA